MKLRKLLSRYRLLLLGVALGAIGGFLYYHFVGCNSGTCMITSQPVNSTLYGALMGGLLLNMFKKEDKQIIDKKTINTKNKQS